MRSSAQSVDIFGVSSFSTIGLRAATRSNDAVDSRPRRRLAPPVWLLRAHEAILGRSTFAVHHALQRSERWPESSLRDLQLRKLRRLIEHAVAHCPHYCELGGSPES